MSIVTRTNRSTNPNVTSATGMSVWAGTGGTASGAYVASEGADGGTGFYRVSWTGATTAVSGGAVQTVTGLSSSTAYTLSAYVKSSKNQTIRLLGQFKTSGGSNVNLITGSGVAVTAGSWSRISVSGTSGASVDRVEVQAYATTGGSNWANGDTLDMDCILVETGSTLDFFFDGGYTDGAGVVYNWSGTANASTSTAQVYTPLLSLLHKSDAPCDRVEITITDLYPSTQNVTLWRVSDGRRSAVRNFRKVDVVGSDFIEDFEVPLGRVVTYELEILSGFGLGGPTDTATITVNATSGWIQDPLDPGSAVRLIATDDGETGLPMLKDEALKSLEIPADINLVQILGSKDPVALMGERMARRGVSFAMATNAAQSATDLRELLEQTPLLLIRPLPEWAAALPGLCYTAAPTPVELPVNEAWGGTLTEWKFETGLVAVPTMNLVIPTWTYQDWQDLWTTYQQAQTALSGDSYLQVKKSPSGA